MRILYINICSINAYLGHKLFDVEWCKNLSEIGLVDLVQPSKGWYSNIPPNINIITFEAEKHVKHERFFKSAIVNFGRLHRLEPYRHACNAAILNFVKELDKKNHYDLIISAHFDIIVQFFCHPGKKLLNKMYLIEHLPPLYMSRPLKALYDFNKNNINHITMERKSVQILQDKVGIRSDRIYYVPHPVNEISINTNIKCDSYYDIIGLSNSNSDILIHQIIQYEEQNNYFMRKGIRVLIRSHDIEYDNGYLKVFKGRLNLSYDEFYTYIIKAKLMLILFPLSFGFQTSGTIIDALSFRVISIGTKFDTYTSYCEDYPNACISFEGIDELISSIEMNLDKKNQDSFDDFDRFYENRTGNSMRGYLEQLIRIHK